MREGKGGKEEWSAGRESGHEGGSGRACEPGSVLIL